MKYSYSMVTWLQFSHPWLVGNDGDFYIGSLFFKLAIIAQTLGDKGHYRIPSFYYCFILGSSEPLTQLSGQ